MTEGSLPIDAQAIQALAQILKEADLSEIEYESQNRRIRVARHSLSTSVAIPSALPSPPLHPQTTHTDPTAIRTPAYRCTITSPMVGTSYLASSPGSSPFVRVGDTVSEGQTVMIVEAMKVMNPIKAPQAGRVAHIFVTDGSPVEFGESLLALE